VSRRVIAGITVWLVATAGLAAADFWEAKPFLEWSDKEAEKLIAESPWAALVSVALPPRLPQPSGDAGGAGGRGGGGDERSFGQPPVRIRVTISWRSALPLRQAVVRTQVGQHGTLSPEGEKLLAQEEPLYVIALQGIPPQYTRTGEKTIESFLRRNGKPPIPAQQAATQNTRAGALLMIGFPKTDLITLDDGDVEFDVKLDQIEIRKKFKLKEMVFAGKLEL
jgi:hypothetical protein